MTDKEIFLSVLPNVNFMTPNVEHYVRKGKYICEVSNGGGFDGTYMVGVTVVNAETRKHEYDLCKSFTYATRNEAMKNAMNYIESL